MENKIILCLTIENEDALCSLDSIFQNSPTVVDAVTISHPGNDVTSLQEYLAKYGISGKFVLRSSESESKRMHLFQNAKEYVRELGWDLSWSYCLFIDSGETIHIHSSFKRSMFDNSDGAFIPRKDEDYLGYELALINMGKEWRSCGEVCEFWNLNDPKIARIDSILLGDFSEEAKKKRILRSIAALEKVLIDERNREFLSRYAFYLGMNYYWIGENEKAERYLSERILMESEIPAATTFSNEEKFVSQMTLLKIDLGRFSKMTDQKEKDRLRAGIIDRGLIAYQKFPSKLETLYLLSKFLREQQLYYLSMMIASEGMKSEKKQHGLCVDIIPYTYGFDEEMSISGFYVPQYRDIARIACDRIILSEDVPEKSSSLALRNMAYYIPKLSDEIPCLSEHNFFSTREQLRKCVGYPRTRKGNFYFATNPSITTGGRENSRLWINLRLINYTQKAASEFNSLDPDGIIRTENMIMECHWELKDIDYTNGKILEMKGVSERLFPSPVTGMEDLHFIVGNCETAPFPTFTGTSRQIRKDTIPQIAMIYTNFYDASLPERYEANDIVHLISPKMDRCEKNWIPFIENGEMKVIYDYHPFSIYRIPSNVTRGTESDRSTILIVEPIKELECDLRIGNGNRRGSAMASLSKVFDGYLVVVHEIAFLKDHARKYFHRFLLFNRKWELKRLSHLYSLRKGMVEFIAGIAVNHDETEFVISYGIEDREAWISRFRLANLFEKMIDSPMIE